MGSTGTGSFTDYPGSQQTSPAPGQGTGGGADSSGDSSDPRCLAAIERLNLEEVERCAFFAASQAVPPGGTDIRLLRNLVDGRLAVATDEASPVVVGLVPTAFNYLLACMNAGHSYRGEVIASALAPVARVAVSLHG